MSEASGQISHNIITGGSWQPMASTGEAQHWASGRATRKQKRGGAGETGKLGGSCELTVGGTMGYRSFFGGKS